MPIFDDIAGFSAALPGAGTLIGLDPGSKTIGVAASDPNRSIAMPVETIKRGKFSADAARLETLITDRGCVGLVVGLPRNMDGSEGPRAQSARAFARNLERLGDLPLLMWDERLSTAAAERDLIAADVSRKKRAQVVDKMAAQFILQGVLDALRMQQNDRP